VSDTASTTRVYDVLRLQIVRGTLEPGARLVEAEIADQLGVSRTPVREAIQRLRADGLAVLRGRRGNSVPEWSAREIEDSQRLRAHLESWAARMAIDRLQDDQLEELRRLASGMHDEWRRTSPDVVRIAEMNMSFHAVLNNASASPPVDQLLVRATHLPILYRVFHVYTHAQTTTALNEHDSIVRALEARDPDWVESIVRAHILAALPALLRS